MSRFSTLDEWLNWLEQLHPKSIDLGLERVHRVATSLGLLDSIQQQSTVITVAGTNGKGSCIKTLEQALLLGDSAGSNTPCVGAYTSPHIHHYCERICVDGQPVSEDLVCKAFVAIDQARTDISLTYFEFGTLAALWIFAHLQVPTILLEVGLGGRLDAVNIVDADIAVITSIAIDHEEWLGNDRDIISQEKLGIARDGKPLIIAEPELTSALEAACQRKHSYCVERDFSFERLDSEQWQLRLHQQSWDLPLPQLPLPSVASALQALSFLGKLPSAEKLVELMPRLFLAGRYQQCYLQGRQVIFDVAHNSAAAQSLAQRLLEDGKDREGSSRLLAVFAVMADKDITAILQAMLDQVDHWYVSDLDIPRAASARDIQSALQKLGLGSEHISCELELQAAFESALAEANSHDRIVVFGSFYTLAALQTQP